MAATKIHIPTLHCKRCGHDWLPRQTVVRLCPRCKSLLWDQPKKKADGRRSTKRRPS